MGLMSTLLGGGPVKTTATTTPWGPQGDQLKNIFSEAQAAYNASKGTPFYQGDLYAKLDALTKQGVDRGAAFATGTGADAASSILGSGLGLLGGGAKGLSAYDAMFNLASGDTTGSNIKAAMAYADNPAMDGMIDAASRDVKRNLGEVVLPEIDRAAVGTGNINSTRAGVASGIAQRGAADAIGDISATMRGTAYQDGLRLAEGSRQSNMGAMGAAGSGFMGSYGSGLTGAGMGFDATNANNSNLTSGGQILQQDAQGQIDADFKKWLGEDSRAMDLLGKYYGIVGSSNWGGTTSSTQKGGGPGLLATGLGLASGLKGLGAFGGG